MKRLFIFPSIVLLCSVPFLVAQDLRTVTEPVLPPICKSLEAELSVRGRSLAKEDEGKLDTARIQQAMDACGKGHGVVLKTHGTANAFLSGPLELREGVTLIVDKGATLFAARDPAFYERSPGSCGLVNESGSGCKPLISAQHVAGAGVMGD